MGDERILEAACNLSLAREICWVCYTTANHTEEQDGGNSTTCSVLFWVKGDHLDNNVVFRYSVYKNCRKRKEYSADMYEIDRTDIQIVNLLMDDGRMPASEIARRVGGISERAVRYRIERMVQTGLIQVTAVVNPKALGRTVVADVWLEVESTSILDVARKMTEFENISYVACARGETDVSVQVLARDTAEVYRFVTEVIGKVPGVRKTTTSIVPLVLKDVYQWRIPVPITDGAKELS
jgi:Lrp/AsnC family transcriptional regulator for asnA, asnC and gidA